MSSIISSRTPHDSSCRRHFYWIIAMLGRGDEIYSKRYVGVLEAEEEDDEEEEILACSPFSSSRYTYDDNDDDDDDAAAAPTRSEKKKKKKSAISRFRSAVSAAIAGPRPRPRPPALGRRVTGTLYGCRSGHMHFAVQADPRAHPAMLVELAASTGALVREMASGQVRIALECEARPAARGGTRRRRKILVEEPLWWAYCNGRKCGRAVQREAGPADWRVLRAVERVTMGAGVLPAVEESGGAEEEVMYMRARFERVVRSKDSEAFYMMNPENINGGPELTIYLLRV